VTRWLRGLSLLTLTLVSCGPTVLYAAPKGGAAGVVPDDLMGRPLALVVLLALVSMAPFFLMATTAFVKISTTLQIVRSAIGAQGVPSNTVVMALAASLTVLAMQPVIDTVFTRAKPVFAGDRAADTSLVISGLVEAIREPIRDFLKANTSDRERARFLEIARRARGAQADVPAAEDFSVLVPSFLSTELTEAFALGFMIYLPFLVVDLVIANILLALGMQQLQPTQISLPFKLFLFLAIDGWGLLARSLISSYHSG